MTIFGNNGNAVLQLHNFSGLLLMKNCGISQQARMPSGVAFTV